MHSWIRRSVVALGAAALLGALTAPGQEAAAATRSTSFQCRIGYDSGSMNVVPTARKPGQKLSAWIPVRNHENAVMPTTNVHFEFAGDVQRHAPVPVVWWRVKNGRWKRASVRVGTSGHAPGQSQWLSNRLEVGGIAPHATKWVQFSIAFPRHSIKGVYYGTFYASSHACAGSPDLSWYAAGFAYWPWHGVEGGPA